VNRLENDPATIEEVARKKFGFLKENEILYDFSKKK
jgi:cell division protein FtsB